MAPTAAYFLLHLFLNFAFERCLECLQEKGVYCLDNQSCISADSSSKCSKSVDILLNCPWIPSPEFAYDDNFARGQIMPIVAATISPSPQKCFQNNIPTMQFYRKSSVICSEDNQNLTCSAYTAFDTVQKAIVLAFRGSVGQVQIDQISKEIVERGARPFFTKGNVFKVFYNNFIKLWNSGLGEDILHLKKQFPDFQLWISGHSMGAAVATIASAYLVETNQFKADQMKIVLLGCPRAGDSVFATWHSYTFPYSYHIIHALDPVPRVPEYDPTTNITMYHAKTEVWYNNSMKEGSKFVVCEQADQPFCGSVIPLNHLRSEDHKFYFNVDISKWAADDCPADRRDYSLE